MCMHRRALRTLLERYLAVWPGEHAVVARFLAFVEGHEHCLLRSCGPGHITASAWVVNSEWSCSLLTHHKKLGKWLQLGGHVDGESEVERACLREAQEESGMLDFAFVPWAGDAITPLDLDVHLIPARGGEAGHLHWDVRFLLQAAPGQALVVSAESNKLAWVPDDRLSEYTSEESVLRMHRKAAEVRR